ncbi:condensation domain-containing protein, partial [Streptomyces sp. URMC 123]|uniref:class I SAM-dependent methyltransferase n=1 Tax=Streptomyces sp. URMC 123 TaxID=3423403 RepID=UPI003F19E7FA
MTTDERPGAAALDDVEDVHVLSPMQEGMLYHTLRHPDSAVYLQQAAVTFHGPLDPGLLRRAWQAVVDRHTTLRSAFRWERLDKPVQVVRRTARIRLAEHDWSGLPEESRRAREEQLLAQDRKGGFDLTEAPLIRLYLARLAADRHRFAFSLHHIIQDGWSTGIMLREVGAAYRALSRGEEFSPPPARPFADYVRWLGRQDPAEAEAFWRRRLAGFTEPTRLLRAAAAPTGAGQEQHARLRTLDAERTAAVTAAATGLRITLNTLLQAAWGVLLARYSGRGDVVFGAVSSGRPPDLDGVEDMVGLFVNTVPTRLRVDPDREVGDWLREVQDDSLAARAYEHVPMTRVQEWSQVPAGAELFETVQVLQNLDADPLAAVWRGFEGLTVADFTYYTRTNYPLTLAGLPGERLGLRISYDPSWLADDAAERLLGHLETLLVELAADPRRRLGRVPLLTAPERERLERVSRGPSPRLGPGAAHRALAEHAARAPEAVALSAGARRVTYGELDRWVNRLVGRLARLPAGRGTAPGSVVATLLPDRVEEIAAVLAVARAGGVPLALDPSLPPDRLAAEVREARPRLVLSRTGAAALGGDCAVLLLDELGELNELDELDDPQEPKEADGPGGGSAAPAADQAAGRPAWVVTTAGTTGAPKAVLLDHAAVSAMASAAADEFGLTPDDVVLSWAPPGSADALLELHLALVNGAELRCAEGPADTVLLARGTDEHDDQHSGHDGRHSGRHGQPGHPGHPGFPALDGVTCLRATPSLLAALPGDHPLPGVRTLLVTGERCPRGALRRWAAGRALFTVYGTAETAGLATVARVDAEGTAPPGGRPTAGVAAYVLDDSGTPLPVGVPGELHLGGEAVARGYPGRPALTAERFRSDPRADRPHARLLRTGDLARWTADGRLEVLGRADRRLAVRGFAVDPAEVEDALLALPDVEQAVVTADGGGEGRRLLAHVVPAAHHGGAGPDGPGAGLGADQVDQWRQVFGHAYAGPATGDEPAFNTAGWNSSVTGGAIPRDEMREWLDATLDRIRALAPRRVLEIGCGTGMLLLPLSTACEQYWATDLSPTAIDYVRGHLDPSTAGRVVLRCQEGDDVTGLPEGAFDLVVLNSVAQYFPHAGYLRRVLDRARRLLAPGGRIFVGDVRSLPLLPAQHVAAQLANSADRRDTRQVWQAAHRAARADEELVLHPDFFRRVVAESPGGGSTRITVRRGRARNEMSRFRYDALLVFDTGAEPAAPARVAAWGGDITDLPALREALAARVPSLLVRGVPDARSHGLARAARTLRDGTAPRDTGALRAAVDADEAVEPDDLHDLASAYGYAAELLVGDRPGTVDALFTPGGAPEPAP